MGIYRSRKGYDFGTVTERIIKCAIAVHKELGRYFMETTYQSALALELQAEGLDYSRECWVDVYYKDRKVDKRRVDFIVEEILVETKAKSQLEDQDYMQTLSYLKATSFRVGLLINFGAEKIQVKRFEWTPSKD
jgi:GxxExxY protein